MDVNWDVINERCQRWIASNGDDFERVLGSLLVEPEPLIVDVGAHKGDFFSFILSLRPGAQIHAFEPNPRRGRKLRKHFAPVCGVHVHSVALGDSNGRSCLHVAKSNTLSSLLPATSLGVRVHGRNIQECEQIEVELCRLQTFADEREKALLGPVDLLKLDVQGYELQVLEGAEDILSATRMVIIEVGFEKMYEGQSLFAQLDSYLGNKGFVLHGIYGTRCHADPDRAQLYVSGDALYLNTL